MFNRKAISCVVISTTAIISSFAAIAEEKTSIQMLQATEAQQQLFAQTQLGQASTQSDFHTASFSSSSGAITSEADVTKWVVSSTLTDSAGNSTTISVISENNHDEYSVSVYNAGVGATDMASAPLETVTMTIDEAIAKINTAGYALPEAGVEVITLENGSQHPAFTSPFYSFPLTETTSLDVNTTDGEVYLNESTDTAEANADVMTARGESSLFGIFNLSPGASRSVVRGFRVPTRIFYRGPGRVSLTGTVTSPNGSISCGGSSCFVRPPFNGLVNFRLTATNIGSSTITRGDVRFAN